MTRRILYGNVHATNDTDNDLEALFNDDDAEIKDGPETLTRRSAARMEAFLASCSVALREDHQMEEHMNNIAENNAPVVKSSPAIEGKKGGGWVHTLEGCKECGNTIAERGRGSNTEFNIDITLVSLSGFACFGRGWNPVGLVEW